MFWYPPLWSWLVESSKVLLRLAAGFDVLIIEAITASFDSKIICEEL